MPANAPPFEVLVVTGRGGDVPWEKFIKVLDDHGQNIEITILFRIDEGSLEPFLRRRHARFVAALADRGVRALRAIGPGPVRPQVAWAPFAGVHLRGDPTPDDLRSARGLGPPGGIVGGAYHLPARPLPPRLDYALVAPVFAPRSSRGKRPMGLAGLRAFVAAQAQTGVPVVALGGLRPDRVAALREAGAAAVAGITCFLGPPEVVVQDGPAVLAAWRRAREGARDAAT